MKGRDARAGLCELICERAKTQAGWFCPFDNVNRAVVLRRLQYLAGEIPSRPALTSEISHNPDAKWTIVAACVNTPVLIDILHGNQSTVRHSSTSTD